MKSTTARLPTRPAGRRRPPPRNPTPYPPWLLPEPLLLEMDGERPCYRGPLSRLVGPQRVEAGWWGCKESKEGKEGMEEGGKPALRDYYVAESPEAGLVWIFRERHSARFSAGEVRWYLQGFYA